MGCLSKLDCCHCGGTGALPLAVGLGYVCEPRLWQHPRSQLLSPAVVAERHGVCALASALQVSAGESLAGSRHETNTAGQTASVPAVSMGMLH